MPIKCMVTIRDNFIPLGKKVGGGGGCDAVFARCHNNQIHLWHAALSVSLGAALSVSQGVMGGALC